MSSLSYLKNLPVNYLKIEGGLVAQVTADAVSRTLVKAINEIGHAMQMRTIAESVDRPELLRELRDIGIDYAQGYLIARPAPLFEPLAEREPRKAAP